MYKCLFHSGIGKIRGVIICAISHKNSAESHIQHKQRILIFAKVWKQKEKY